MRIGVSLRSGYAPGDAREGARWMIERAAAARDAGLDSLFVGDHHVVGAGRYYQNTAILGRLLAEWDGGPAGPRPAGALFLLPLWHPVLVAEHVGTLAALARGRVILQCAIGGDSQQFAGMGASLRTRPSRFEAALGVIRRLLDGEIVDLPEPFGIQGAQIGLTPPERVEVWVGGHAPAAVDRAARLGDGWLAGPELVPADAQRLAGNYLEQCDVHGRTPTAVAIRRDIHVGEDDADAHRVADPVLARGYRGFDPSATIIGGPETVAARIAELGEMGYTDVIIRHLADEQGEVLASFGRLATVRELSPPRQAPNPATPS